MLLTLDILHCFSFLPLCAAACSFHLWQVLGQGSFGKVLMAEHKKSRDVYAVKVSTSITTVMMVMLCLPTPLPLHSFTPSLTADCVRLTAGAEERGCGRGRRRRLHHDGAQRARAVFTVPLPHHAGCVVPDPRAPLLCHGVCHGWRPHVPHPEAQALQLRADGVLCW